MKIAYWSAGLTLLVLACGTDDKSATGPSSATTTTTASGGASGAGNVTTGGGGGATGGASGGGAGSGGATTAGSGGTSGGGGTGGAMGGGRPAGLPASDSAADIGAFIKSGGYKMAPWVSDVAMPRPGTIGTQHSDNIRVWMNATLVAALKAGRNGQMPNPFPDQWSMAVKEMYDGPTNLVGIAASFKTTASNGGDAWVHYCYGPTPRCQNSGMATESMPIYGRGNMSPTSGCSICHGNTIYTPPPP